jgi:hypothetical protein
VYKGIVFFVLAVVVSGCFDPPVFPTTPEIEFESIYFGETPGQSDPDSLVIAINFKDGDGNVGINKIITTNGDEIDNVNDPYHNSNFYLSDGGTSLKEIGTETFYTDTFQNGIQEFVPIKILTTRNQSGKLVTLRNQAGYSGLPPLEISSLNCIDYTREKVFIFESDWNILDSRYYLKDTLRDAFGNQFISIRDTLYFQVNPNHYTIEVDFFIKQPSHPDAGADGYREYDWMEEFCTTFDGRFSQLSDTDTPLEGTIRYSMKSTGFPFIFSAYTMKLRISIKDRDLNVSNVIYTPEFTLDKIKAK